MHKFATHLRFRPGYLVCRRADIGYGNAMQGSVLCKLHDNGRCTKGVIPFSDADYVYLLRNQGVLPEHQARRDIAGANLRRLVVYVLCATGLYGRVYAMDKASDCDVFNGIYANDLIISRTDDLPTKYALRSWHYVGS